VDLEAVCLPEVWLPGEQRASEWRRLDLQMLRSLLRFIGLYLGLTAAAALALSLVAWPHRPASLRGWIVFFVAALPVIAIGDWLGSRLSRNQLSARVERATRGLGFSWIRVFYFLLLVILFVVACVFLTSLWER